MAAVLVLAMQVAHPAALSEFYGPVEYTDGLADERLVDDGIYHRNDYSLLGGEFFIATQRSGDQVFNPADGDTWILGLEHVASDQRLGEVAIVYDAATDCLLVDGVIQACDIAVDPDDAGGEFKAQIIRAWFALQCAPLFEYRLVVTFPEGAAPGSPFAFQATRFAPHIASIEHTGRIAPDLPGDNFLPGELLPPVDPGRTGIGITITDSHGCGVALEDVKVALANTLVAGSGGHHHFAGSEHGDGSYEPLNDADTFDPDRPWRIEGVTDAGGEFRTRYTAGELGVTERIEVQATVVEPLTSVEHTDTGESNLDVKVSGLTQMQPGVNGDFVFRFGGGCLHSPTGDPSDGIARWVTPRMKSKLLLLNALYFHRFDSNLSFNDASLPFGGKFDNDDGGGRDAQCHESHRRGIDIDVNGIDASRDINIRKDEVVINDTPTLIEKELDRMAEHSALTRVPEPGKSIHYRDVPN